jgi:hypothetical protein
MTGPLSSRRPVSKAPGPPEGGPGQVLVTSVKAASGWDKARHYPLAGARGGFHRAPRKQVRRLAALHLQSPIKHVNQVRTTSFLW